jgi:hypothetical protein
LKQPECACLISAAVAASHTNIATISIYLVHDDAKEKDFELEMSWIGDETKGLHLPVPKDLMEDAEAKAKAALETFE